MPTTYSPREMIERLIAFDTTSRESNLELIGFIADYLADYGIASSLSHDDSGGKANLFATIGEVADGGIVLSGHTDVVPVDGQTWASDPFTATERDGRLYGRGTCDMKSFIAIVLALVPDFLAKPLSQPVHLAFSYDEEVGCLGVHRLIEDIRAQGVRPQAAIIGEPTEMEVVDAHKGIAGYLTSFRGVAAHSSATHIGVSATHAAGRFVAFLDDLFEEMQTRARPELGFVPPYTTIQVGVLNGGTASNIIAQDCLVNWHFRAMPTDDPQEITDRALGFLDELRMRMQAHRKEADITTLLRVSVPPLKPDDASPATNLALALTGSNATAKVSFATEASAFQQDGIAAVVCGPGSIAQAHQPDEFIALEQIEAGTAFMRKLIERLRR